MSVQSLPSTKRSSRIAVAGIVLGALAFVLLTLLLLHELIPQRWQVRRSILINAPTTAIHSIVNDLSKWPQWAQWNHHNLNPSNHASSATVGVGAELTWQAAPTSGHRGTRSETVQGRIEIVRSDPNQGVWLQSVVSNSPPSTSAVTYERRLGSTEVTWTDQGQLDQLLGGLSIDIFQQQLGTHMEKGLLLLKAQAESNLALNHRQ